ncbi:PilZ domain-containing protein [Acetivibrio mesophilus]|uniref:PilZ domain-containing protein n=1 Tax=Acetivibrio mesophilus TaxID=2487273 RepID=A0A4Q0I3S9_9FIRM|nr:PilZ domain-containing protein [Acetivibrio mesophilus]ODM26635.1 pilus assembly protein PilZ [Clostridium sp. Bc-iso-3]RXE58933.1 PilZ domain-containing protein [Acetivibrio mesophilus]
MKKDVVSRVLKEGMVVNTKLKNGSIWIQNIVYKVEKHLVSIALLSEYLENIIMLGQSITVKYSSEHSEILFEGEVVKIRPEYPSYVTIDIKHVKEIKNTRIFPRHDVYLGATVRISDSPAERFVIIHNISLVGMAFYSKDYFEIDSGEHDFSIFLPNRKSINSRGKVNRRSPKSDFTDYGLQYTDMTEESNNTLSCFFNLVEEEKMKLRDQFVNCVRRHL